MTELSTQDLGAAGWGSPPGPGLHPAVGLLGHPLTPPQASSKHWAGLTLLYPWRSPEGEPPRLSLSQARKLLCNLGGKWESQGLAPTPV